MITRLVGVLLTAFLIGAPALSRSLSAAQPPQAQVDGFVPIDQLPPREQLPAAPFLIAAYVFVWLLLMAYVWSIARRLGKVEREVHALERRASRDVTL